MTSRLNNPDSNCSLLDDISGEGNGLVRVERVNGRSVVVRDRATAPLKLICPQRSGDAAWIYTSGYGGGLVAGDSIGIDVSVGAGSTAVITTQASTKVYHRQASQGARQRLNATVQDDAMLAVLPDPLVCYTDAIYDQKQIFDLSDSAGLILLDWLTCGRREMDFGDSGEVERWSFSRYRSRNTIRIDGRVSVIDDVLLDETDGPIASEHRVGRFNCLACVFLVGEATKPIQQSIAGRVADTPISKGAPTVIACSQMPWGGVLRIGGASVEDMTAEVRRQLDGITEVLGVCPWTRKW